MNQVDYNKFFVVWGAAQEVTGGKTTDAAMVIAFKTLEKYDLKAVQQAVMDHIADPERGRFPPKPADIIALIEVNNPDGRPEPDEAWSIAMTSFDENETVVLNDEIAAALEYSRDPYLNGDKYGARNAFIETYTRKIKQARKENKPVKWWPSLGHDKDKRRSALEQAVIAGRIGYDHAQNLTPLPISKESIEMIKNIKQDLLTKQ